ncbi:MAG: hypothetical protein LBD21_00755 [Tannerellaceae bacterium]|jgi:hypothetical protein|nr:hypothetical protein [Tannerellaceae bacterium]
MYRELIRLVAAIIAHPGKTWQQLAAKTEQKDEILTRFVYPLIGLATLAAFAGIFFTEKHFVVELALKAAVRTCVACFGSFFLAAWILNETWSKLFRHAPDIKLCRRFTAYSSTMMFALEILLGILPEGDFFFLRAFLLYTAYIVWEGAPAYMGINNQMVKIARASMSARMALAVIITTLIILLPMIINYLMFLFLPGLRL